MKYLLLFCCIVAIGCNTAKRSNASKQVEIVTLEKSSRDYFSDRDSSFSSYHFTDSAGSITVEFAGPQYPDQAVTVKDSAGAITVQGAPVKRIRRTSSVKQAAAIETKVEHKEAEKTAVISEHKEDTKEKIKEAETRRPSPWPFIAAGVLLFAAMVYYSRLRV